MRNDPKKGLRGELAAVLKKEQEAETEATRGRANDLDTSQCGDLFFETFIGAVAYIRERKSTTLRHAGRGKRSSGAYDCVYRCETE